MNKDDTINKKSGPENSMLSDMAGATDADTPPKEEKPEDKILPLDHTEQQAILTAIHQLGNIPKAAKALGVSPSTIYRKLKQWKID